MPAGGGIAYNMWLIKKLPQANILYLMAIFLICVGIILKTGIISPVIDKITG